MLADHFGVAIPKAVCDGHGCLEKQTRTVKSVC